MLNNSKYDFKKGKKYDYKQPKDINEYLQKAEAVHDSLENYKIITIDGVYWKDLEFTFKPEMSVDDLSIYSGSCGITYFYLELYKVTHNIIYKELVLRSADYLDIHWEDQLKIAPGFLGTLVPSQLVGCGITIGIASIGMVLSVVYKEFKREKDLSAINSITSYIVENAVKENEMTYWTGKPSAIFDAGIVLYLYKINEILKSKNVLETAIKATDTLIKKATIDERGGYRWSSFVETIHLPNYDGTAGTAFVLSVAYQYTNNKRYLDAAIEGAKMIKNLAVVKDDTMLVPFQDLPGTTPIYYMSTCNGPAGTSRLFYNLFRLTGNQAYLEDMKALYRGMRKLEVPEKQSEGYWNTTCICCGTAGVLQYAINYYSVFSDENSRDVAILAGNILLSQSETQRKGVLWPMAFERVKPKRITRSIAYETGSTGNAAALLQLYLFLTDDIKKWDRLFDDPF